MILRDIAALLDAKILVQGDTPEDEIVTACGADLMSDVLSFIHPNSLLLSGLTNPQIVRTAEMVDVAAIVLVRGKAPSEETLRLADETGMPLLLSPHSMFECCGRLWAVGVESCDIRGPSRKRAEQHLREFGHERDSTTSTQS